METLNLSPVDTTNWKTVSTRDAKIIANNPARYLTRYAQSSKEWEGGSSVVRQVAQKLGIDESVAELTNWLVEADSRAVQDGVAYGWGVEGRADVQSWDDARTAATQLMDDSSTKASGEALLSMVPNETQGESD